MKQRKMVISATIIAAVLALGYIGSLLFPAQTSRIMLSGLRLSAGLSAHTVETSLGPIHYLEGGDGETVVFLHGIFARKEHWIDMSRAISGGYRVILLDLPGFGDNQMLQLGAYDFDAQKQHLVEVLDQLGLDRFHLAANSMSAQLAGMIAVDHPARVQSVAFIGSPVGVTSPLRSDMETALAGGSRPLVVQSRADYEVRMDWLFPRVPFIPAPVSKTWAAQEVAHGAENLRIWQEVAASTAPRLEELAPEIAQPALILWCAKDRIFHISGAEVLAKALPAAQLVTFEECGHLPMLDQPKESGRVYRAFLDAL